MKRVLFFVFIVLLISGINPVAGQSLITKGSVGKYPDEGSKQGTAWKQLGVNDSVRNISQIRFGSTGDPLNGLTLTWKSSGTADKITWGYTANHEKGVFPGFRRNQNANILFDFTFPSLTANSVIHYALFDSKDSTWTEGKTYKTSSDASGNRFSFTAFGDSRTNPGEWKTISEATMETDFTLFLGDIIASGSVQADWDAWFAYGEKFITRELIYHTIGNHDKDSSPSRFSNYLSTFTMPGNELYYSFTYGNAVFICLNTENSGDSLQYKWLLSTLEANKVKTWKFVFFHKPFFTSPSHTTDMVPYFNTIWKAFDNYGVDMIFNGHTHNYQRTRPINRNVSSTYPASNYGGLEGSGRCQVVTGSAGAPLGGLAASGLWWLETTQNKRHFCNIEIDGKLLTFKALDANHVVFDQFVLDKSITGLDNIRSNISRVYPNPSNGEFYIKIPTGGRFSYRIFNSFGQQISESQNGNSFAGSVRIELTNQPSGLYFIELNTDKETSFEKIILY